MTEEQEDKLEGVYTLYEEFVADVERLKKLFKGSPPSNMQDALMRTFGPVVRDLAHYARENRLDIDDLLERVEALEDGEGAGGASEETQFTQEDAQKFDLVLQFAQGAAQTMLSNDLPEEERKKISTVLATAEACLKVVEESTLMPEPEGGDEGGEGEGADGEDGGEGEDE